MWCEQFGAKSPPVWFRTEFQIGLLKRIKACTGPNAPRCGDFTMREYIIAMRTRQSCEIWRSSLTSFRRRKTWFLWWTMVQVCLLFAKAFVLVEHLKAFVLNLVEHGRAFIWIYWMFHVMTPRVTMSSSGALLQTWTSDKEGVQRLRLATSKIFKTM